MFKLNDESKRQLQAFMRRRRAFYSLIILTVLFLVSLFVDFYASTNPIVVKYQDEYYYPIFVSYPETVFGGIFEVEADYTDPYVKEQITKDDNWALYPPIKWDYKAINRNPELQHPSPPTSLNYLGTDDRGRDVLARIIYGFRISIIFGFVLAGVAAVIGVIVGSIEGYFGGWVDILVQRGIEIWRSVPHLYLLIIMASIFVPSLLLLIVLLSLFDWIGVQAIVRIEFLGARGREYVKAARALGVSNLAIMWRHILPNALTLVITTIPFSISAGMSALVALDFLGLGVPPPTPSLGELLRQAQGNLNAWWIGVPTIAIIVSMLILVTFVGEAILDVFDPKRR